MHEDLLKLLDNTGIEGVYEDEDGDIVVQYDPDLTRLSKVKSTAKGMRYEVVRGGFHAQGVRTGRVRPVPTGTSHGALDVTAGSTGILVEKDGFGPLVDTNYHVAAGPVANRNEPIVQPGEHDGGDYPNDAYGKLKWYLPMEMEPNKLSKVFGYILNYFRRGNERPKYWINKSRTMRHDVALVEPFQPVEMRIVGSENYPRSIEPAPVGEVCMKSGRTTGITHLKKESDKWSGDIKYSSGLVRFVDQNLYKEASEGEPTSRGGDSGSTICWDNFTKVDGRLFAGNAKANTTIGNPYDHFAEEYNIELWSG